MSDFQRNSAIGILSSACVVRLISSPMTPRLDPEVEGDLVGKFSGFTKIRQKREGFCP